MSEKSSTEVIIGGKVYTLSGYEGEEWVSDYDFVPGCRQLMRQTRASNI